MKVEREMRILAKSANFDANFAAFMVFVDFQNKIEFSPLDPHCGMKTDCQFY